MSPRFRLQTFGRLALHDPGGTEPVTQPRRLALLALVAASGPHGLTRDKALAALWPERSAEKGRHALEQTIYELRRQLGDNLIASVGPMRVDPAVLGSDIGEFRSAVADGRFAEAVTLYQGPFCDGFYLSEVPEFERWTETTRETLAGEYLRVLDALSSASRAAGDAQATVEWSRLALKSDPFQAGRVLALMDALVRAGQPDEAMRESGLYQQRIGKDLELSPDPRVAELAMRLKRELQPVDVPAIPNATPAPVQKPRSSPVRRLRGLAIAGIATGLAVAGVVLAFRSARKPPLAGDIPFDASRLFVAPFRVVSPDSSLALLREGAVDFLAAQLGDAQGLNVVDPRAALSAWYQARQVKGISEIEAAQRSAARLGAGRVLLGDIVEVRKGSLLATGSLFDARTGRAIARASVAGPPDSIFPMLDALALKILAFRTESETVQAILAQTPREAMRAYLVGRALYRHGDFGMAQKSFERALAMDSTFVPAAVGLVTSGLWTGGWDLAFRRVAGLRQKMSGAERALVEAIVGPEFPAIASERETLAAWRKAVALGPDRVESWFGLGNHYWRMGAALGIADWPDQSRRAYERCLSLDSSMVGAADGLIQLAAERGDSAEVRHMAAVMRAAGHAPDDPVAPFMEWVIAGAIAGDSTYRSPILATLPRHALFFVAITAPLFRWATADGERAAVLFDRSAVTDGEKWTAGRILLGWTVALGESGETSRVVDGLRHLTVPRADRDALDRQLIRNAIYGGADTASARAAAREVQARSAGPVAGDSLARAEWYRDHCVLTEWALWRGELTAAQRNLAALAAIPASEGTKTRWHTERCRTLMAAAVAVRQRDPAWPPALAMMDSVMLEERPPFNETEHMWLVAAGLYREVGRPADALLRIRRGGRVLRYVSSFLRMEAELAAETGDTAAAIGAWRRFVSWRGSGSSLAAEADSARRALGHLRPPGSKP